MEITRTSIISGISRTVILPITSEQLFRWMLGEDIQVAMPGLTDDQREFVLNGITPEEWDDEFGEDDE